MHGSINTNDVAARLEQFALERDWEQFHTPKNLAMALVAEAGELVEVFQWLTPDQSELDEDSDARASVAEELADILIYAVRLADLLDIDLAAAIDQKIKSNRLRYPVGEVRASAVKRD